VFALCTLQTAILIFLNYHNHLEKWLTQHLSFFISGFAGDYFLFLTAFVLPYFFYSMVERKNFFRNKLFIFFMLIAPAIFALKISLSTEINFVNDEEWNHFWNQIYYWPARLIIVFAILLLLWKRFDSENSFYGATLKNFSWKPYALMLLFVTPLIALASTQQDFLATYPKLHNIPSAINEVKHSWFYKLLFELSYGSDFCSIEIFFRGFLILAFIKWVGKAAILPMACFYCTIHFGKPLGECISSYFGGLLLGIVVYDTRSIYGGLMVHLGIAWLMELGGYIGNYFF
jgi:hypothetical protein